MGSGTLGTTWRAELADGSPVAIKRLATRGRNTSARLERLQRAAQLRNANLLELLSIFQEEGRFWVASRLDDGVPLSRLLRRGRLRAAFVVAVGMGVLNALTSLHQVGLSHGAIHARNVHVGRDGTVRLGDYGLSSPPSGQSPAARRAADVRAVGALLCSLLGVPAGSDAGRAGRRSKVAEGPVGVAVRAIAADRRKLPPGHEAIHASLTLWEAAPGMTTARRQAQTREQLARMVATVLGTDTEVTLRLVAASQPAPPLPPPLAVKAPQSVDMAPSRTGRESARAPTFLTGLVVLLVTILTVGFVDAVLAPSHPVRGATSGSTAHAPSVATGRAQVARPQLAPPPSPSPVLPPTSAGDVMALTLRYDTPACGPGSVCHVRVDLAIQPSRAVHPLTWTVYSIDACTGELTPLGIAGATVLRGWTRVVGDSFPRVPAGHASRLVAITDGPARASSAPVALTDPAGCAG
jgi:hypothetical protein